MSENTNNSISRPSVVDMRQQLMANNKAENTVKGYRKLTNKFIGFVTKELGTPSTHPALLATIRNNSLHKDFMTDDICSRFLTYSVLEIQEKGNSLYSNIRGLFQCSTPFTIIQHHPI